MLPCSSRCALLCPTGVLFYEQRQCVVPVDSGAPASMSFGNLLGSLSSAVLSFTGASIVTGAPVATVVVSLTRFRCPCLWQASRHTSLAM